MKPSSRQVRKRVFLDIDDVQWFEATYGGATLTWIVNILIKNFRALHKVFPEDTARQAAAESISEAQVEE